MAPRRSSAIAGSEHTIGPSAKFSYRLILVYLWCESGLERSYHFAPGLDPNRPSTGIGAKFQFGTVWRRIRVLRVIKSLSFAEPIGHGATGVAGSRPIVCPA